MFKFISVTAAAAAALSLCPGGLARPGALDRDAGATLAADGRRLLDSGGSFSGDLTYYGGAGDEGACTQTYVPSGFTTVAINSAQWDGSAACGTCVEASFDDGSTKTFSAIVDNLCPECSYGDLDLGESGDGRWPLTWTIIPCPTVSLIASAQGSNNWYAKLKFEGGVGAVRGVACDGEGDGVRTTDNFWQFDGEGFCDGLSCTVSYVLGGTADGYVDFC